MRRDPVGGAAFVAGLVVLVAIIGYGMYTQFAPEDGPPPPAVTLEDKRLGFMAQLNEKWGIERIHAHTVTVGPKFASLTPDEKQSVIRFLVTDVFDPPTDGTADPDQAIVIVDSATGKQITTFTIAGLKLSE